MRNNQRLLYIILCLILLITTLGGCAGVQTKRKSAEQLYSEGMKSLEGHTTLFFFHVTEYEKARSDFEEIKNRYSYTTFSPLAELRLSDIHFDKEEYAEAIAGYTDFLRLHPDHKDVPYAIYQLSLSHFNQMRGVDRDQTPAREALVHFKTLLDKFPESEFAKNIPEKIEFCKESISAHEFYVASFYYKNSNYPGAIERFKSALEMFPGFGPKEDALLNLGRSYLALDNKKKGIEALERLMAAFPDSKQAGEASELLKTLGNQSKGASK